MLPVKNNWEAGASAGGTTTPASLCAGCCNCTLRNTEPEKIGYFRQQVWRRENPSLETRTYLLATRSAVLAVGLGRSLVNDHAPWSSASRLPRGCPSRDALKRRGATSQPSRNVRRLRHDWLLPWLSPPDLARITRGMVVGLNRLVCVSSRQAVRLLRQQRLRVAARLYRRTIREPFRKPSSAQARELDCRHRH